MPQPLKVLIAEDNPSDAELVVRELRRAGFEPEWQRVDTEAAFLERLNDGLDLVLSDYDMPQFGGLRALELLKQSGLEVPFIIVSGTIGEETAVAAMKHGAADYLLKDRLARLGPAVSQALESNRLHAERCNLEEQLRQAQKMEAVGTLAGGIAHDFNNILSAIVGYTELAQLILKEDPKVREYLHAVLKAARRASDLVRQILTFSRQQPQERRPIQLAPVMTESLNLLRATIPSTIEFDLLFAPDAPTVLADATQIHQVLMNLGTNAWHAMRDRTGRLQVKLERCVVDEAYAATQRRLRPGVYARVSVSDTGCGMDQATQRRIFEPFFTTKPPGEGTGLGLSVVHGIMNDHDGAATVYSQPGEGTIFHLYFPAYAGEATVAAAEEGPVSRGHGERVLFVDDEELLVQLGQKTLVELGYEVEITTQPAIALAMVLADPQRIALVLTDQTMPQMTGFALASKLLQIRPGLPIILMTGYSAALTSAQVEAAGIRQLLFKPMTIHSLGTAVHAALSTNPLY
jgi:signal transduction histidine kinase